jgi:glycogen debranching enzyme
MWSGWGIRTLSKNNPAYNPYEYQRGSIWPQDNAFIANGFKRYGLTAESNKVIRGIFDAIERFQGYRPPEVFAGLDRQGDLDFPVLYPRGANIPQAWASGSIFFMLGTMLGLRADAPTADSTSFPHFLNGYLMSSCASCVLVPAHSTSASGARESRRAGK